MNTPKNFKLNKIGYGLLTLSAASLLVSPSVLAQDQGMQDAPAEMHEHPDSPAQDPQAAEGFYWEDIEAVLGERLEAAGLDEEQVFEEYDENNDGALNQEEFETFLTDLQEDELERGGAVGAPAGESQQDPGAMDSQEQGGGLNGSGQDAEGAQNMPPQTFNRQMNMQSIQQQPIEMLQGRSVKNTAGETVGNVQDVVINRETGAIGILVTTGGIFGFGRSQMLAPLHEISMPDQEQDLVWNTDMTKRELRSSGNPDADSFVAVSNDFETIGEIGGATTMHY